MLTDLDDRAALSGCVSPVAVPLLVGAMTAVIAAACACNLYGNDGASLWLTVILSEGLGATVDRKRFIAVLECLFEAPGSTTCGQPSDETQRG